MNARDLDRYKRMLLEKHEELAAMAAESKAPIPAAGIAQGDLIDQANADSEAELRSGCGGRTGVCFAPSRKL